MSFFSEWGLFETTHEKCRIAKTPSLPLYEILNSQHSLSLFIILPHQISIYCWLSSRCLWATIRRTITLRFKKVGGSNLPMQETTWAFPKVGEVVGGNNLAITESNSSWSRMIWFCSCPLSGTVAQIWKLIKKQRIQREKAKSIFFQNWNNMTRYKR